MSTSDEAEVKTPRRSGRLEGRGSARLPGVRRLPPCRHRQHLDIRGRRTRSLRARAARALRHGAAHPAHRRARLGFGAQGSDELPVLGAPRGARRGDDDLEARGHGPEHHLRGDPHLFRQLLRARDREPSDPERQPGHQLHHGLGGQGPRPSSRRWRIATPRRSSCRRSRSGSSRTDRNATAAGSGLPTSWRRLEEACGERLLGPRLSVRDRGRAKRRSRAAKWWSNAAGAEAG